MTGAAPTITRPYRGIKFLVWMMLAVGFFAGFVWLGTWQVYRYQLKLGIAHDLHTRVHAAARPAPGPAAWTRAHDGQFRYLHVRLRGTYIAGKQTLVRGTSKMGYGFWVMQPLRTARGFVVLVNRGYIPAALRKKPAFVQVAAPTGEVTLTGLVRTSEPGGGFIRSNDPAAGNWYSRDVAAIAKSNGLTASEVAPYFVDAAAGTAAHTWPQGGLTKVSIYNHSLGYAITWYALALGTVLCAWIVIRHERPRVKSD